MQSGPAPWPVITQSMVQLGAAALGCRAGSPGADSLGVQAQFEPWLRNAQRIADRSPTGAAPR
ncbi:MAG: hypothetical protein QM758_27665 [Armatimonas sp.]